MAPYRDFIASSRGEFTVAKDIYVRPNSGWFSDRSVCYLAAGRPVVTMRTGFSKFYPVGRGLFEFSSAEEAISGIDAIAADYAVHSRAARELAREYFAAERVLDTVMGAAGLSQPGSLILGETLGQSCEEADLGRRVRQSW